MLHLQLFDSKLFFNIVRRRCGCIQSTLFQANQLCTSRILHVQTDLEDKPYELDDDFKKRIFNTKLWEDDLSCSYLGRRFKKIGQYRDYINDLKLKSVTPSKSLCLNLLEESEPSEPATLKNDNFVDSDKEIVSFPFTMNEVTISDFNADCDKKDKSRAFRTQKYRAQKQRAKASSRWLSDYEFFDEKSIGVSSGDGMDDRINYGTADPSVPVSRTPCGGCGALLHCQGPSIPGYLPKEVFLHRSKRELRSLICQRCHFMKEYNVALDANVSPEEYPKILSQMKDKRGLVVLLVDLLDFPCSIWPNIIDLIGTKRPVVVVGNKIDLIPGDHKGYLDHIAKVLKIHVEKMGIDKANIKYTALVSAQTGFGVEDLITHLHDLWDYKSDIYLLGCTNVGKSTLFNTLIQSDFCKVQAVDYVQRATTSIWPGTTLNLLKFPVLRPEGWRLAERRKRLDSVKDQLAKERKLLIEQVKRRRMYHMPSFFQYVGQTFSFRKDTEDESEVFSVSLGLEEGKSKSGINEKDFVFSKGRWCYDTPGVMHPDQILDLLTIEELIKVLPRKTLVPHFFTLKPGKTIFLAGLGRLDFISCSDDISARFTVFTSEDLPITISNTSEADDVYNKLLGSELMAVPCGGPKRLSQWPGLKPSAHTLKINGINFLVSCADIVLSSTGWISINGAEKCEMFFKAWTPMARGIYMRQPALIPYAFNFRGKRIDHTPMYNSKQADGALFTDRNISGEDFRK